MVCIYFIYKTMILITIKKTTGITRFACTQVVACQIDLSLLQASGVDNYSSLFIPVNFSNRLHSGKKIGFPEWTIPL